MKPITKQGFENLKVRLEDMKKEFDTLPEIIAEAREKGDLKENAEYHAARERQGILQAQIAKLESDMAQSQVIDPVGLNKDIVTFGKIVTVVDEETKTEATYKIVGDLEADMDKNEIGISTPVAKGMLTKKVGDIAIVNAPAGQRKMKITNIAF